jgi:hypothetical protein
MMKRRCAVFGLLVLGATACSQSSGDPKQVAAAFWEATQAGDIELAKSYAVESGSTELSQPDGDSSIEAFTLGETTIDGEEATVETRVTTRAEQGTIDVDFQTVLVRETGEWRVDLGRTTQEFATKFIGASLSDMAEQMGKALGEAMGSAMQGIADDMKQEIKPPDEQAQENTETP